MNEWDKAMQQADIDKINDSLDQLWQNEATNLLVSLKTDIEEVKIAQNVHENLLRNSIIIPKKPQNGEKDLEFLLRNTIKRVQNLEEGEATFNIRAAHDHRVIGELLHKVSDLNEGLRDAILMIRESQQRIIALEESVKDQREFNNARFLGLENPL
jgi:hypothetical protein